MGSRCSCGSGGSGGSVPTPTFIQAGGGTSVTGSGTELDPFIITATGPQDRAFEMELFAPGDAIVTGVVTDEIWVCGNWGGTLQAAWAFITGTVSSSGVVEVTPRRTRGGVTVDMYSTPISIGPGVRAPDLGGGSASGPNANWGLTRNDIVSFRVDAAGTGASGLRVSFKVVQ